MSGHADDVFCLRLAALARAVHDNETRRRGNPDHTPGELIALLHSEASELLEAIRAQVVCDYGIEYPPADHIDPRLFSLVDEELADVILRALVLAAHLGSAGRIGLAVLEKCAHLQTRPTVREEGKAF